MKKRALIAVAVLVGLITAKLFYDHRSPEILAGPSAKIHATLMDMSVRSCRHKLVSLRPMLPPTRMEAANMLKCFTTTDFWKAYDKYGFERFNGGTGNGLNLACTQGLGLSCRPGFADFMRNALAYPEELTIIDQPGEYSIAEQDFRHGKVLVLADVGSVTVAARNRTKVFFLQGQADCTDLENFDNCHAY